MVNGHDSDRPAVFVSYSRKDRDFIGKVVADLRNAGLTVWHDLAEIRPGESIRHRIFEHGLVRCDVVFVYYTEPASQSRWVQREIDAASVRDVATPGGIFALFVDSPERHRQLPLDLQALNVPVFTRDEYCDPLASLISRAWNRFAAAKEDALAKLHAIETARLVGFRDTLFEVIGMHKQLPVFKSFEWTHTILDNGDGITEARVALTTDALPISWWRVHLGATESVAGTVAAADLDFTAVDETTGRSLRAFAVRDDIHDKDIVILFPRVVQQGDVLTLRTRHLWPQTWRILLDTGTEFSRFSVERLTEFVSMTLVFPESLVPVSFDVDPSPAGAEKHISASTAKWSTKNPNWGRHDWKVVVRPSGKR